MSLAVCNVNFAYRDTPVLRDVSFSVQAGRLVSLLGPNGVGKSTLFQCMLGLLRGYTGDILLSGRDIRTLSAPALAREIAYIPQAHYPAFHYSVFDMVLMGTASRLSPFASPGRREAADATEALERMGVADLARRDYMRISGGERQLVLIARALAQRSRILVMDEPTANLDYGNQIRVLSRIRALSDMGYTVIQSTHNPEQSFLFSHQILAMLDGRILADGPPRDVLTPDLIGALYNIDVQVESLRGDALRVCVPVEVIQSQQKEEPTDA